MRAVLALLLLLSSAPAARAESVRDAGTVVGTAGARPIVSDGVRFVAWIKAGRLWIYDDLRRRRTSEALPADRCWLNGGSARGIFLLGCRGRGSLVWDRGIKPLRGALPTDFPEFIGRHWAVGSDGTGAPIAVHLGTGERVRGEPWTGHFDPDSPEPRQTDAPDTERHRGDWTLVWDEGVFLRRHGRFHRRLAERCQGRRATRPRGRLRPAHPPPDRVDRPRRRRQRRAHAPRAPSSPRATPRSGASPAPSGGP